MAVKYRPERVNRVIALSLIAVIAAQLFIIPILLRYSSYWGIIIVLAAPLNVALWAVIHEAIHKNFTTTSMSNDQWGRALSICFGASFHVLRFSHLMHHRFNRDWESEIYDPQERSPVTATVGYYVKLVGGLYLLEVVTSVCLMIFPALWVKKIIPHLLSDTSQQQAAYNFFLRPDYRRAIRYDGLAIIGVYAVSLIIYGRFWPWLLALIFLRAFIISVMDNAYHYATPADNTMPAKELWVPNWLSKWMLHFNHHKTHHLYPHYSWIELEQQQVAGSVGYDDSLLLAMIKQFKGPIPVSTYHVSKGGYHGKI